MKVGLDTNVWFSAIFWKGEANKIIEFAEKGAIDIIVTNDILLEVADVLSREAKFQKFLENKKQNIEDIIKTIISIGIFVDIKSKINIIKEHPSDNKILEAALDGKVKYLISYDKHILSLHEFKGIKIIRPDEFLKML